MIEKENLEKDSYYFGECRNSNIAMWDGTNFLFINKNFDKYYLEDIELYKDDSTYDEFKPFQKIKFPTYLKDKNKFYLSTEKYLKGEEWRDIIGYEGLYKISNFGRVKNNKELIKKQNYSFGYLQVGLTKNKKIYNIRVHREVFKSFKGKFTTKKNEINHINGIKTDNRVENLEKESRKGNATKMYNNSNSFKNKITKKIKTKIKKDIDSGLMTQTQIASKYGISQSVVSTIKNK